MTVQDVLFRLKGVKRNGNQWKALCPAHADKNPSLSIRECKDGHILLYCHAGCNLDDIVKEMGITTKDLFVDGTSCKFRPGSHTCTGK